MAIFNFFTASKVVATHEGQRQRWTKRLEQKLDGAKIESLVKELSFLPPPIPEAAELLRLEADYFARNVPRMRYPEFRRQDLFVGSGVIEAGCKTVIGSRLKRSGMFWTVRGANAILALRCNRLSGKFEDYWKNRWCA